MCFSDVKPGSTLTFTRHFPYIASILFTRVNSCVCHCVHVKIMRQWKSTLRASNRPFQLVCFVFPFQTRELFLWNVLLSTCICMHNLQKVTWMNKEPYCCVTTPLRLPATTYYVPAKMDVVVIIKKIFVENTYYHNIDGGHESQHWKLVYCA